MKKNKTKKPTKSKFHVLLQICNLIPGHLVSKLGRESGAEDKSRSFSCWSHVLSMLFAQLTHSIGLNDVCDALQLHRGLLAKVRGATPPSRNTLSHANKVRPAEMAEKLFWSMLEHLTRLQPGFGRGKLEK